MKILFTQHALKRLAKRSILTEEVISAVKFPDLTLKKYGKYYYQKRLDRGWIEVCCEKEKDIYVITVYWM